MIGATGASARGRSAPRPTRAHRRDVGKSAVAEGAGIVLGTAAPPTGLEASPRLRSGGKLEWVSTASIDNIVWAQVAAATTAPPDVARGRQHRVGHACLDQAMPRSAVTSSGLPRWNPGRVSVRARVPSTGLWQAASCGALTRSTNPTTPCGAPPRFRRRSRILPRIQRPDEIPAARRADFVAPSSGSGRVLVAFFPTASSAAPGCS